MFELGFPTLLPVVITVIFAGISLSLWYLRRNDDYWKNRGVPYFPRENLISMLLVIYQPMNEIMIDLYKKYGRVHGFFEFGKPVLLVAEPELLRDILVKDFHKFSFRREFAFGDDMLDNMVSILTGEDWKRVRTIITPAFTSKRMREMSSIINERSKTLMETFEKHSKSGEPIDGKRVFGAFTVDVIASAAFATKIDSLNDPDSVFAKHVRATMMEPSLLVFIFFFLLPAWMVIKFRPSGFKALDFLKDIIIQIIKERKGSRTRYKDFLQLLMDAADEMQEDEKKSVELINDEADQFGSITHAGLTTPLKYKKISQEELIAQCILFFFAGFETTTSTLSFMAYALAVNQECQDKLIQEVDEAFLKHKEMSYDAVRDMKYLDGVVSETLRMYPPLPRLDRTATEDYNLGDTGIVIEKGTVVGIPIYPMHYDPEFFPEPEKFDPERFMGSNKSNHPQYAYLPFGAGPRNCLGMRFVLLEIKLCIANILHSYRFQVAPSTKIPLKYMLGPGFLRVKELPLRVEKRLKE